MLYLPSGENVLAFEVYRVAVIVLALSVVVWPLPATAASKHNVRIDTLDPFHTVSSSLLVGNKGEEVLDVSVSGKACGARWLFDHAVISVVSERFGAAQFVSLPEPGCTQCQPLRVRWFHEPTGNLDFEVHVYRRHVFKSCSEAVE